MGWESDWLMAFHPDRCSVLSVTKKKQPIQHSYILHNQILESVSSAKYLGIIVQSNLKWDKLINIPVNPPAFRGRLPLLSSAFRTGD